MKDLESYGKALEENAKFYAGIELTMLLASFIKYKELYSFYQNSLPWVRLCLEVGYLMLWITTSSFLISMSHASTDKKIVKLIESKSSAEDILEEYRNSVLSAQRMFKISFYCFYMTIAILAILTLLGVSMNY